MKHLGILAHSSPRRTATRAHHRQRGEGSEPVGVSSARLTARRMLVPR
jgi:hypothetical protein